MKILCTIFLFLFICCSEENHGLVRIKQIAKKKEGDEKNGILQIRIKSDEDFSIHPKIYLSRNRPVAVGKNSVFVGNSILFLFIGPILSLILNFKEQDLPISNNDSVSFPLGEIRTNTDYLFYYDEGDFFGTIVSEESKNGILNNFIASYGYDHSYGNYPATPEISDYGSSQSKIREVCKHKFSEKTNETEIFSSIIVCSMIKIKKQQLTVLDFDTSNVRESKNRLLGSSQNKKYRMFYGRLENPK
ncbi:MAG TPA: hypothetical protein PL048_17440 [Leptospiraceae bacterium]|nr:hypothetical protein [Leptospiraceae bacterium]HMZ60562.1 hypothetical protein [Leptospiraceae bacterium]HNI98229.1 hypothetical protein [Leptospiraceae bacterium]